MCCWTTGVIHPLFHYIAWARDGRVRSIREMNDIISSRWFFINQRNRATYPNPVPSTQDPVHLAYTAHSHNTLGTRSRYTHATPTPVQGIQGSLSHSGTLATLPSVEATVNLTGILQIKTPTPDTRIAADTHQASQVANIPTDTTNQPDPISTTATKVDSSNPNSDRKTEARASSNTNEYTAIKYSYVYDRNREIATRRSLNDDPQLHRALTELATIAVPEQDALCPHHVLTPIIPNSHICRPVPLVNKKPSAAYNVIHFSDTPDAAITCPSDVMEKGVYNSGCPATHIHNTPSWWHCHINNMNWYVPNINRHI